MESSNVVRFPSTTSGGRFSVIGDWSFSLRQFSRGNGERCVQCFGIVNRNNGSGDVGLVRCAMGRFE
nr:hypothetical protein Itr_chr06CG19710 [Ipomoea trifida]